MKGTDLTSKQYEFLPRINLDVNPESRRILAEQKVTFSWTTKKTKKLFLIQETPGIQFLKRPRIVPWGELEQRGEQLELEGKRTVRPKSTTAYIFAAVGERGRYVASVIINVKDKKAKRPTAKTWYQFNHDLDPDFVRLDELLRDHERFEAIRCSLIGPRVELDTDAHCLFRDQEATVRWRATCSTYVEMNSELWVVILEADNTQRSGTSISRFVGGGAFWPFAPSRGEVYCTEDFFDIFGLEAGCQRTFWVSARDDRGRSAVEDVTMGYIPYPKFEGCDPGRQRDIETTLLDIYCCLFRNVCLAQNVELDHSIAAFRDGHLSRVEVYQDLLDQLQNLHLMTFKCRDVADAGWRGGQWTEYTNEFEIQWSPLHRPNLFYVILHEFIHKVGFHGDLLVHYTDAEIENQAQHLTAATMRCCQVEIPEDVKPGRG